MWLVLTWRSFFSSSSSSSSIQWFAGSKMRVVTDKMKIPCSNFLPDAETLQMHMNIILLRKTDYDCSYTPVECSTMRRSWAGDIGLDTWFLGGSCSSDHSDSPFKIGRFRNQCRWRQRAIYSTCSIAPFEDLIAAAGGEILWEKDQYTFISFTLENFLGLFSYVDRSHTNILRRQRTKFLFYMMPFST